MQRLKYSCLIIFLTIYLLTFNKVRGSLKIIKITTRTPKPKDIGLIFDITLENSDEEIKELLKFRITSSGYCSVNVTPETVTEKMGRIVGGKFGFIEPGTIEKVSLIWPSVSLYNRVGLCPILITSTNINNEEKFIKQVVKFDTRFEALDPDNHTLRQKKEFVDCQNWDKEYLKNCTPVDCVERYFGLRNFYNNTSEKCEEVPRCSEKYQLYDAFANECTDTRVILSDEDLKGFKEGKFDNNIWKFKLNSKKKQNVTTVYEMSHGLIEHANEAQLFKDNKANEENSDWLHGLGKGILIVFLTIAFYLLICFSIFLFVNWLSRRSIQRNDATPRHWGLSEENIPLYTTSSLISYR